MEARVLAKTSLIDPMLPMGQLDAGLEVVLEVLMELLGCLLAVLLLLTAEVGGVCPGGGGGGGLELPLGGLPFGGPPSGGVLLQLECSLDLGFRWVHCRLDCLDHLLLTQCGRYWIHLAGVRSGT